MKKFKSWLYVFMNKDEYEELEEEFCAMMAAWQLPLDDPARGEFNKELYDKYFCATDGQNFKVKLLKTERKMKMKVMNFLVSIAPNVKHFVARLKLIHKYPQYLKMTQAEFEELEKKYDAMIEDFESHREDDGFVIYPYDYELSNTFENALFARNAKKDLWTWTRYVWRREEE